MKKVFLTLMCMAAMMVASTSLKAQQVTIPLMPGWTWISYPSTDTLDFAAAFGSFTPVDGDIIMSQYAFSEYNDGEWFGDFELFYPGYGYMYYSNRTTPVLVTFNAQQPAPSVVVTTSEPMLITAISAMGGGEVTVSDGTYILVRGLCWATHENPTTNEDSFVEEGSGVGSFTASMTGLNISTTYYVRAYAVTPIGTVYGDQKTFTTRDGIPTLTTAEVTNIAGATATCGGNITDNGGLNVTARGVCWSTSPDPTIADSHTTNGSGLGSFSSSITGLNVSTTYYVRAYATTAAGTAYGDQKTFTTRDGIPSVTTADVTNIMAESATCGGTVTDNCGLTVIARGVCWSTSPTPTLDDSHTTNGSGNGSFSSSITGLSLSTIYYVRAYATTSAGTGYGEQLSFTTRNGIPTVATSDVTNIGPTWAHSGGTITDDGGLTIIAKGVCWSISPYPTLADSHTNDGNGTNSYTSYITGLNLSTTYYVRAYVTNSIVTVYGNQLSFTTPENWSLSYVDLGLPSGLLWATCNVGADNPEDYGDYFAWGETQPKDTYNWSTYQYCNGRFNTLTKYCTNSNYGYNGFVDNLTTLLPEDDAATVNWGDNWRMPTKEEWQELYQNTTNTWTTQNGVNGRLFTASNGNSLFLPAAGVRHESGLDYAGSYGPFWSSTLYTDYPSRAWYFYFDSDLEGCYMNGDSRFVGHTVRPVCSFGQNNAPTGAIDGLFSVSATQQVYFSQGNLQYQASTDTWKFADNQWDYVGSQNPGYGNPGGTITGSDNSNISSTYSGWIDLFGWGTSGYNHGADCWQPWSTNETNYNYWAYGGISYNLYDESGQADWGYNPISNGGDSPDVWRTLTQSEWAYVFDTRSTTSGIRYAKAQVNGVNGVILLPDDWSTSTYSLNNANDRWASFSSNTLTALEWSTLEQAGAVFLPAAGDRYGTSVSYVGSYGDYWSASDCNGFDAYRVYFTDSDLDSYDEHNKHYGFSVRVVCNVE